MTDANAVQEQIASLFLARLKLEVPSVDSDLFETGALDSLAFVELLLYLEQEFGIRVSIEELEMDYFRSIARIADFIVARNGGSGAPGGQSAGA